MAGTEGSITPSIECHPRQKANHLAMITALISTFSVRSTINNDVWSMFNQISFDFFIIYVTFVGKRNRR